MPALCSRGESEYSRDPRPGRPLPHPVLPALRLLLGQPAPGCSASGPRWQFSGPTQQAGVVWLAGVPVGTAVAVVGEGIGGGRQWWCWILRALL